MDRLINPFAVSHSNVTRARSGDVLSVYIDSACAEVKSRREREDKVGREVTTRILYILGTFTIRISPGGCCHVPLGHVPGVRPKGLRASSRHPFSSSAPISRSFFFFASAFALSSSFSFAKRSLQGRDLAGEKWCRQKDMRRRR